MILWSGYHLGQLSKDCSFLFRCQSLTSSKSSHVDTLRHLDETDINSRVVSTVEHRTSNKCDTKLGSWLGTLVQVPKKTVCVFKYRPGQRLSCGSDSTSQVSSVKCQNRSALPSLHHLLSSPTRPLDLLTDLRSKNVWKSCKKHSSIGWHCPTLRRPMSCSAQETKEETCRGGKALRNPTCRTFPKQASLSPFSKSELVRSPFHTKLKLKSTLWVQIWTKTPVCYSG